MAHALLENNLVVEWVQKSLLKRPFHVSEITAKPGYRKFGWRGSATHHGEGAAARTRLSLTRASLSERQVLLW